MCSVRQEQWVYAIATSHTGSIDKISWELAGPDQVISPCKPYLEFRLSTIGFPKVRSVGDVDVPR